MSRNRLRTVGEKVVNRDGLVMGGRVDIGRPLDGSVE